eukprot:NODE_1098_length_2607_cov_4.982661.p1 GENE.NODE_1098_length_2607_cov_4.982661~~NODE_1098_length_2607_cov_4.982661.p1  ORF type:complete len:762 (+),score=204.27 NODE_1098_length_2607_cov_4.982661:3-2288(+)
MPEPKRENEKVEEVRILQALLKSGGSESAVISAPAVLSRLRESLLSQLGPEQSGEPFLVNLSSDSALSACCRHYVNDGFLRVGSGLLCGMRIQGIGIMPVMCHIGFDMVTPGRRCFLLLATGEGPIPRVLVNGLAVVSSKPQTLMHGDRIIFGYAHAYRFILPAHGGDGAVRDALRDLDLGVESALAQVSDCTGEQFHEVAPLVQAISLHLAQRESEAILRPLRIVCPLVDELNEVIRLVGLQGALRCRVHAASSLSGQRGQIVAIVEEGQEQRGAPLPVAKSQGLTLRVGAARLLHVWSVAAVLSRMEAVRALYSHCARLQDFSPLRRRLADLALCDPWSEAPAPAFDNFSGTGVALQGLSKFASAVVAGSQHFVDDGGARSDGVAARLREQTSIASADRMEEAASRTAAAARETWARVAALRGVHATLTEVAMREQAERQRLAAARAPGTGHIRRPVLSAVPALSARSRAASPIATLAPSLGRSPSTGTVREAPRISTMASAVPSLQVLRIVNSSGSQPEQPSKSGADQLSPLSDLQRTLAETRQYVLTGLRPQKPLLGDGNGSPKSTLDDMSDRLSFWEAPENAVSSCTSVAEVSAWESTLREDFQRTLGRLAERRTELTAGVGCTSPAAVAATTTVMSSGATSITPAQGLGTAALTPVGTANDTIAAAVAEAAVLTSTISSAVQAARAFATADSPSRRITTMTYERVPDVPAIPMPPPELVTVSEFRPAPVACGDGGGGEAPLSDAGQSAAVEYVTS